MTKTIHINQKWLKASVLGCLWASSEIVLGSFLHNLRIPFSGSILTGIGIIILVSVSYLWKEKGLFWRSGLVCSLMKSVSPSAFIFGPMIAIFMEGLLLEAAVRISGRNVFAYILGGMLAMSWTLFQKIANLVIIYGFHIVELYENLALYASDQLHILSDNIWAPVGFLWMLYLAGGIFSAIAGILTGKKALRFPTVPEDMDSGIAREIQSRKADEHFRYSLTWLGFNIAGMIITLFMMNYTDWKWWTFSGLVVLTTWGFRYHKAMRPLKKPRFWIFFILITMLTSFLFTELSGNKGSLINGILTGIQMNFRAAVMVVGFSAIGTELLNPSIGRFFSKTAFRQLHLALEVAFETLPFVIARLSGLKHIFRRPVSVLHQLISHADYWLQKLTLKNIPKQPVTILTGKIGQGKSGMLEALVKVLQEKGYRIGGIVSPCRMEEGHRTGYDLVDVATGKRTFLSGVEEDEGMIHVGRFYFSTEGIAFGKKALSLENVSSSDFIVVDEIGPWELENQGWAPSITTIFLKTDIPMIWCVRESIVDRVIESWELTQYRVFHVADSDLSDITSTVSGHLSDACNGQVGTP
jgi:nucleoside-triphosphatase THEP1